MAITEKSVAGLLTEAVGRMTNPHRNDYGHSLEDWISTWAQENGSAVEIWGDEELWQKIKAAVDAGSEIKVMPIDTGDDESYFKSIRQASLAGFEPLAYEDNIDSAELIVYKPAGGAQTPPEKPSMNTPKQVANVEAILNRAVKRIGDGAMDAMDLSRYAGVGVAQLADSIEDMASMVAGLINRTPDYDDRTPNGRKLAEFLRHADYFLSQAHEILDEEANVEGEQERRKTRLPSMANTPAAESVELVRKMIGEAFGEMAPTKPCEPPQGSTDIPIDGEDAGAPYQVSGDVNGTDNCPAQQWIQQARAKFPNLRSRGGPNSMPEFRVPLQSIEQVKELAKMYGAQSISLEPGRRGTIVTLE